MIDLAAPGLLAAIASGVAVAVAIRHVVWLTRVESWSMAPTLRPRTLLLTRRLRRSDGVRRGDIVVLRSAELGRRVVKRVVGLPGETVVVDSGGVSVDGVPLAEPYVLAHGGAGGSFSVPDGAYLVLGDNRPRSSDSRSWRQPFVARSAVEGRWIRSGAHPGWPWTRLLPPAAGANGWPAVGGPTLIQPLRASDRSRGAWPRWPARAAAR